MFKKVSLKEFNIPPENIAVFDGTIFVDSRKRNSKYSPYSVKAVDAICSGRIAGMITDLELGKVGKSLGLDATNKLFYRVMGENPDCLFYEIMMAGYLDEYKTIPAYCKLFKLCEGTNLHVPDLTSVIASIETDKPLVSNDSHHWQQQRNISRAYIERHSEKRAKEIEERRKTHDRRIKTSDMIMYDSKDFCDFVLHL